MVTPAHPESVAEQHSEQGSRERSYDRLCPVVRLGGYSSDDSQSFVIADNRRWVASPDRQA
ncbi:MAG: hypothetical protein SVG88_14655 [Halobacteriales archaeon]|nr:hypothetical protein [Halobacteriales archaeon]